MTSLLCLLNFSLPELGSASLTFQQGIGGGGRPDRSIAEIYEPTVDTENSEVHDLFDNNEGSPLHTLNRKRREVTAPATNNHAVKNYTVSRDTFKLTLTKLYVIEQDF